MHHCPPQVGVQAALDICFGSELKTSFRTKSIRIDREVSRTIPKPRTKKCRVRARNKFSKAWWTIAPRRSETKRGARPNESALGNFSEAD